MARFSTERTLEAGVAVLHFPEVYIHSSEGRPAIDAGTGWTQEAVNLSWNTKSRHMVNVRSYRMRFWGMLGTYENSVR
jgi:hypothetical protein